MKIVLLQHIVFADLRTNLTQILMLIHLAKRDDWLVFPEGMLSGYFPADTNYITKLDRNQIFEAIGTIQAHCDYRNCYCLFGTAYPTEHQWFNATVFIQPGQTPVLYFKNNLAHLDREHFAAGNALTAYSVGEIQIGIQMCRELLFPEQWRLLRQRGAKVVFHLNNAVQPRDVIWKHVLITRALENQMFIVSVNNAASPQSLPSFVISPSGEIIVESPVQQVWSIKIDIDLDQTNDYYLNQIRSDLARIVSS